MAHCLTELMTSFFASVLINGEKHVPEALLINQEYLGI